MTCVSTIVLSCRASGVVVCSYSIPALLYFLFFQPPATAALRRFRLIKAQFVADASPTGNASSFDHGPEDITPSSLILVPGAFFTVG
jgi:hypothetical protein